MTPINAGLERQSHLRNLLNSTGSLQRPLLTHLSADNSWLLSVPIPSNIATAVNQGAKRTHHKKYIHLLLDAWLTPSNTAFASAPWFQVQTHVEVPACQSIADVIALITDIETAATPGLDADFGGKAEIDAVVAGHMAADHLNYDTLKQVNPSVPVFVADIALPTAKSWNHFETVVQIPHFGTDSESLDWRAASTTQAPHLPPWLTVWRIPGPTTLPALHWGICIIFETDGIDQAPAECVIQSPHGLFVDNAAVLKMAIPPVKTLALLHTTKEAWYYRWGKGNLGARNGAQIAEEVGARYCKFTPFFTWARLSMSRGFCSCRVDLSRLGGVALVLVYM